MAMASVSPVRGLENLVRREHDHVVNASLSVTRRPSSIGSQSTTMKLSSCVVTLSPSSSSALAPPPAVAASAAAPSLCATGYGGILGRGAGRRSVVVVDGDGDGLSEVHFKSCVSRCHSQAATKRYSRRHESMAAVKNTSSTRSSSLSFVSSPPAVTSALTALSGLRTRTRFGRSGSRSGGRVSGSGSESLDAAFLVMCHGRLKLKSNASQVLHGQRVSKRPPCLHAALHSCGTADGLALGAGWWKTSELQWRRRRRLFTTTAGLGGRVNRMAKGFGKSRDEGKGGGSSTPSLSPQGRKEEEGEEEDHALRSAQRLEIEGGGSLVTRSDIRYPQLPTTKTLQLLIGILQAILVAGLVNGLDPVILMVAATAGLAATLIDHKEMQKLLEFFSLERGATPVSTASDIKVMLRKLEYLLEEGKQNGKVDLTALDAVERQKLGSMLFLLKEAEGNSPLRSILTAPMHGIGAVQSVGNGTGNAKAVSSVLPDIAAEQTKPLRIIEILEDLTASSGLLIPTLRREKFNVGVGSRIQKLLKIPGGVNTQSEVDLAAFNLGTDAASDWASTVAAVPRDTIYVPLTLSYNVRESKPFRVVAYGLPLVLFRPAPGEIVALPDACPHRGASLATGVLVRNDEVSSTRCVRCPYHGLEFSCEGKSQKPNIHSDPVKVVEANGIVWIEENPLRLEDAMEFDEEELSPFLRFAFESVGLKDAAVDGLTVEKQQEAEVLIEDFPEQHIDSKDPMQDVPFASHFKLPGFSLLQGTVEIEAPPKAVVDNTFDLHHMHHVHSTTFGGGTLIRTWQPNSTTIIFEYSMPSSNPLLPFFGDGRVQVRMERFPPYSAIVTVGDSAGKVQVKTLSHVVPTSATKSTLVWQLLRNFCTATIFDPIFRIAVQRILSEDKEVLERVNLRGVRKGMDLG